MRRAAALAVLALGLAGCSSGSPFADRPKDATVTIEGEGCWSADVGSATREGCGPESFEVHDDLGMFSSNVQKKDDSADTVTIAIVVDGEQVASNSTSAAYGVAQVIAP